MRGGWAVGHHGFISAVFAEDWTGLWFEDV